MKISWIIIISNLLVLNISAQTMSAGDLIVKVKKAQAAMRDVSYQLHRIDSFVSGEVWDKRGECEIKVATEDRPLGFYFWGKRNDMDQETIYDGKVAYAIDHVKKSYDPISDPAAIFHVLGAPGGQMVFKDLVQLDTSKATQFEVGESRDHYRLTMHYPDNSQYNITDCYKMVYIDKKTFLPTEEIDHINVLKKTQNLHFIVEKLKVNLSPTHFKFEDKAFLTTHVHEVRGTNPQLLAMIGKELPDFTLSSFTEEVIASSNLKGKAVLLDFWAVWCGPCIAAMPKVEALYQKYKAQGLDVIGLMIDEKDKESAKLLAQKRKTSFPMLVGNEKLKKDFKINAVPLYILVDKTGKISFLKEGFTDELEEQIKKLLNG